MSDFTQYKKLELPKSIERYSVQVFNKNNMIIDSELHKIDIKNQSQDNLFATKEALNAEISRATRSEEATNNSLQEHISNKANPHNVTKGQIGLGNVNNTTDLDKPVSTAQQNLLNSSLSSHNTSSSSHNDIRLLVSGLTTRLNALADSDDTTLDQLSEIVAYIKNNRTLIDSITTSKVSISDIVDNLTSTVTNKPLSARQGQVLKSLITELTAIVGNKVDKVSGKGLSTNDYTTDDKNKLESIASGAEVNVQSDWNVTNSTSDAFIKNKPVAMPASDVSAWAKSPTKPSYNKSEIGLGNVENKSSATIRSELTSENITTALGYTPLATDIAYTAGDQIYIVNGTIKLKDVCTSVTDWNDARTNGWYMGHDASNSPIAGVWFFGLIIAHNKYYVRQILYRFASDNNIIGTNCDRYERVMQNNVWGNWVNTTVRTAVPANAKFTDTNTWKACTKDSEGYVLKGNGQVNKVWKTDASGNPGWRYETTIYNISDGNADAYLQSLGISSSNTIQEVYTKLPIGISIICNNMHTSNYTKSLPIQGQRAQTIYYKSNARGYIEVQSYDNNLLYVASVLDGVVNSYSQVLLSSNGAGITYSDSEPVSPYTDMTWIGN